MTIQEQIEQWKKEAAQSETITSPKQIPTLMYQAQNDANRSYDHNSALERQNAIAQIQAQTQAINSQAQAIADVQQAKANVENIIGGSIGEGIGGSVQQIPSLAQYVKANQPTTERDGVMKYIADHPEEAQYVQDFLALNDGVMDGIKYKNYLKQRQDYEQAQKWLDPSYKMNKAEEKQAEKLALDRIKVLSSKKDRTPEEEKELQDYNDLFTKTDEFSTFAINAADQAIKAARGVKYLGDQGYLGPVVKYTQKLTNPLADKFLERYDEAAEGFIPNISNQNPIASGAGRFLTNAALYSATNPAFDTIAEASGLTGAGKFALNQAAQFGQDVALDTIPEYVAMKSDGEISDAEKKELGKQALYNAGGNLLMGGLSELFKGVKSADNVVNGKTINDATETALNELKTTENVLADAQKQKEDAIAAIQNLSKQNEEVLPVLGDMTKGAEVNPYTVTKAEPEIPKMDTIKPEIAENVQKSASDVTRPEFSAETQDQIMSDFEEMYNSLNEMEKAATATGNPKAVEKYEKLRKAINNYEETVWKAESQDDVNTAKKAADAARQSFIREVKKTNPDYKGELTGTKIGNAGYRRAPKGDEKAAQELADSIAAADKELNTNRWVQDAAPETQNPYRGVNDDLVMAEDVGLNPKTDNPKFQIEEIDESKAPKSSGEVIKDTSGIEERGLSKHIRGEETPMKVEGVSDDVLADFKDNPDLYVRLKNADTKAKADTIFETSNNPENEFRRLLEKKDPAALPLGNRLARELSANGNHEAAAQLYRDMGKALTESGQFSQAAVIDMVKNDPMTALQYAIKEVDQINAAGAKKYGKKWKDFSLLDEEMKMFDKIKPGDVDAIKDAYEKIGVRLGQEYPSTLMDKIVEFRRAAMLFNPRTISRNTFANPPTLAMRWLSDRVEAVGQNVAHIINPKIEVTQSIYGSGVKGRKLATEVYKSNKLKNMIDTMASKSDIPELKNSVMRNKQVFKGGVISNWVNKLTNNGITRLNDAMGFKGTKSLIQSYINGSYKALDITDSPFVKENFVERLGSYIAATGKKNIDEIPDDAILMAWEEAMKATYKDNSQMVQAIRNFKGGIEDVGNSAIPGLGKVVSQSAIPFVQAPGNIGQRMIDYSAVGGVKGLAKIRKGAKSNDVKLVQKGIEEASKGLTGTALVYLGMKLKQSGLLTGTYSEDKKQKAFQKQNGFREFALHVGNQYHTVGWAQPFAQSLMAGVLIQDAIDKSDEMDSAILKHYGYEGTTPGKIIGVTREAAKSAVNSWFNETPLKNLAELIGGSGYGKTDIASNIWENGVEDFAGALVPASVAATTKVADTTQRQTYDPSDPFGTFLNAQTAKLPGLSDTLPAKYDTWGREMKYGDTKGQAAFSKLFYPGEYAVDKNDEVDNEINRLFNETLDNEGKPVNDEGIFPSVAPNSVNGTKLTNVQISDYQKDIGQRNRQLVEAFMDSDTYKNMNDLNKVETIKNLYAVSKQLTERGVLDKEIPENSTYKKAIAAFDEAGGGEKGVEALVNFYAGKNLISDAGLNTDSKAGKEALALMQEGKTEEAQKLIENQVATNDVMKKYNIDSGTDTAKAIQEAIESGDTSKAESIAKKAPKSDITTEAAKEFLDKYDINSSSKAADKIKENVDAGNLEEAERLANVTVKTSELCKANNLDTTSKAGELIQKAIESNKPKEAEIIAKNYGKQKEILSKYELKNNSKVADEVLEAVKKNKISEAEKIAKEEANRIKANAVPSSKLEDYKEQLEKYDLDDNDNTKHVYKQYGAEGIEIYKQIGSTGLKRYENAKAENSSIPSLKDYAKTYSTIDSYGEGEKKGDGHINQDEFTAYAQAKGLSQEEARKQAELYGDWKTLPTLQSDGSYKFTSANSSSGKKSSGPSKKVQTTYANAQAEGDTISFSDFQNTYNAIDSSGKKNGTVSRDEVVSYGIANGMSQEQIQALARTYGDWKTIPVLQPDGSYKWKKVK